MNRYDTPTLGMSSSIREVDQELTEFTQLVLRTDRQGQLRDVGVWVPGLVVDRRDGHRDCALRCDHVIVDVHEGLGLAGRVRTDIGQKELFGRHVRALPKSLKEPK